jgi:hypothetical protein
MGGGCGGVQSFNVLPCCGSGPGGAGGGGGHSGIVIVEF